MLPDGALDRSALRQIVFADPLQRKALEAITHPAIRDELRRAALAARGSYTIVAIPLLAEAGGRATYPWLDRILVVDVPAALQHARLMRRDGATPELASRMIAAQAAREQRKAIADDIVSNEKTPERLEQIARRLDVAYRVAASEH